MEPRRRLDRLRRLSRGRLSVTSIESEGLVSAKADGLGNILVRAGNKSAVVAVRVQDFAKPRARQLPQRRHRRPQRRRLQCRRLPRHADRQERLQAQPSRLRPRRRLTCSSTRDVIGRRTDRQREASLLMLKGARPRRPRRRPAFPASSVPAQALTRWFAEGLQDDAPGTPVLIARGSPPRRTQLNEPVALAAARRARPFQRRIPTAT